MPISSSKLKSPVCKENQAKWFNEVSILSFCPWGYPMDVLGIKTTVQ